MPTFSASDFFSITGLIASVILGGWGIYLALRRAKYPASLTFVREQSVSLLDDFATKLPNLSVLYKNTPINKNVVLISGYLVNDGNIDISPQMVERPLSCRLPDKCEWLEFRVTETADALKVETKILNQLEIGIQLGLFRRDESFAFQALALIDEDYAKKAPTSFADKLIWAHRIASLGSIKVSPMPRPDNRSKTRQNVYKVIFVLTAFIYIFVGLSQILGAGPIGAQPSIAYELEIGEKKSLVKLIANRDGTTTLKDLNTSEQQNIDLIEFSKPARFFPFWTDKKDQNWITVTSGLLTIVMALILLILVFRTDYQRYRTRKLVAASLPKPS